MKTKTNIVLIALIIAFSLGIASNINALIPKEKPDYSAIEKAESEELCREWQCDKSPQDESKDQKGINRLVPLIARAREQISRLASNQSNTEHVKSLIFYYCQKYGVNYDLALRIATAESGLNPNARNKNSSAKGIYEFLDSSWKSYSAKAGRRGESVFNADANIETAIWTIKNYGTSPWNVSKSKWK